MYGQKTVARQMTDSQHNLPQVVKTEKIMKK